MVYSCIWLRTKSLENNITAIFYSQMQNLSVVVSGWNNNYFNIYWTSSYLGFSTKAAAFLCKPGYTILKNSGFQFRVMKPNQSNHSGQ